MADFLTSSATGEKELRMSSRAHEAPSDDVVEPSAKRVRTSSPIVWKTLGEARVKFWRDHGTWPTGQEEISMETIESFRDMAKYMRAQKRPSSRIGSDANLDTETSSSELQGSLNLEEKKNAPYIHPYFEI
ncbi:ee9aad6c-5218-4394-bf3b-05348644026a [Sclerotinia trifoliorum]|uniref:Ee9aad6c-5218-4394-bf3b-05348644026a n=1 Tax=Sclerotinia trifoliorum TaxID=28548 RepID=A0A8H2W5F2_9HELO|nr:ee9aad6c-5218-4394-bf3b-05348644026a [Sclerotinia trifoliorum]